MDIISDVNMAYSEHARRYLADTGLPRERPEAHDKGCFVLSGIDTKGLLQSVEVAVRLIEDGLPGIPVPDYVDENVSTKVVRIIQSYVGVVNIMVWRKEL